MGNSARQDFGIQVVDAEPVIGPQEHVEQLRHGAFVTGLVEAQAQLAAPENAQVDLRSPGTFDDGGLGPADFQRQGVEEVPVHPDDTVALKPGGKDAGQPMNPLGNSLEPFGAVVDRIETGDIGQQHLGRADVGVGLLPANVLLAGLQGHAQGGVAPRIFRNTDDPPGNRALVFIAAGKKCCMRPAVAHGHAKSLGRAEHHIGTQFTRRGQQQQAQQIRGDTGQGLLRVQVIDQWPQVVDFTVGVGVLQQRAEHLVLLQVIHSVDDQLEAETLSAGLHHGNGLRVAVFVDKEQVAFGLGDPLGQGHGFRRGGGFIEQRGIGQLQAGQVDGQLLEVQQRFEPPLGDLWLIGGVRGVPAGIFQHITQNDRRCEGAVVAHADQAGPDLVLLGITAQLGQRGLFIECRGQVQRPVEADARRHRLLDQFDPTAQAEAVEHRLLLGGIGPEVAAQKGIGVA
ncbi:hypothetical protein D3C85_597330 [compost metagenome]